MSMRLIFHVVLLSGLAALGVWLVYKDLVSPEGVDFGEYKGILAAMYWFAALLFGLLSSLTYAILRRLSFRWTAIAYVFVAGIAVFSTVKIVTLGQRESDSAQHQSIPLPDLNSSSSSPVQIGPPAADAVAERTV